MLKKFYTILLFSSVTLFASHIIVVAPLEGEARPFSGGPWWARAKHELNQMGYDLFHRGLKEIQESDIAIFDDSDPAALFYLRKLPTSQRLAFIFEPPVVKPLQHSPEFEAFFQKVITWDHTKIDNVHFHQFYYPVYQHYSGRELPTFDQRKLACIINGNKVYNAPCELYSRRREVVAFYEKNAPSQFDVYGSGWSGPCHAGSGGSKLEIMKNYKFSYCFENFDNDISYISEKIFDCFACLTVPIYLGASNIDSYVPQGCYIDARSFGSIKEMHDFISHMDENKYAEYINNIKAYLDSTEPRIFTQESLVEVIVSVLKEMIACQEKGPSLE